MRDTQRLRYRMVAEQSMQKRSSVSPVSSPTRMVLPPGNNILCIIKHTVTAIILTLVCLITDVLIDEPGVVEGFWYLLPILPENQLEIIVPSIILCTQCPGHCVGARVWGCEDTAL